MSGSPLGSRLRGVPQAGQNRASAANSWPQLEQCVAWDVADKGTPTIAYPSPLCRFMSARTSSSYSAGEMSSFLYRSSSKARSRSSGLASSLTR